MSKDLKEVLTELQNCLIDFKLCPDDFDPKVRAAVEMKIRQAGEKVKELEEAYKKHVLDNLYVIEVTGPNSMAFAQEAQKQKCLAFNYRSVNERFVRDLELNVGKNTFSSTVYVMFLEIFNKIKKEYEITKAPFISVDIGRDGIANKPIPEAVDMLLDKIFGNSLNSAILMKDIVAFCFKNNIVSPIIPVVVYNSNGIDNSFLKVNITIDDVPSEDLDKFVVESLKAIKKTLKKSKEN